MKVELEKTEQGIFIPVSELNDLRRQVCEELERRLLEANEN